MPRAARPPRVGATRRSSLEGALGLRLALEGIPFVQEYRALPPRRWRWDFALLEPRILIEVQGGTWTGGRHTRGAGYANDAEKRNAAQLAGWRCFDFTADQIHGGQAMRTILGALAQPTPEDAR